MNIDSRKENGEINGWNSKKINEFTRLSKERELTEEEKKEREKYRRIYIDKFKESLKGHLDNIKIVKVDDEGNPVDDDGNVIPTEAWIL